MRIRNRHAIKKAVAKSRRTPRPWPALVGDGAGTIEVPGSPGLWYVRPVGSSLAIPVYKGAAPAMNNYPVWVGQDVYNRRWVRILGTNLEGMTSTVTTGGIVPFDVEPHGSSHYLTGSDPIYITTRQVADLLLTVVTGMTVRIAGGFVIVNGQPAYVAGQNLDLTSYVPTDACWIIIRADDAGALSVQEGAEVDSFADLTLASIPEIEPGYAPLWAVRMYGQTTINGSVTQADFFDLRFAPMDPGGSAAASTTTVDTTNFDGILSVADTDVQAALDTLDDHGHITPALDDLTDVTITTPSTGDLLTYDGDEWVNEPPAEINLNDLGDVDITGSSIGDIIYNAGDGWSDYPLGIGTVFVIAGQKLRIGDVAGGDYLQIDATTGSLRLIGAATTYDDLRIDGLTTRIGVVSPTDEAGFRGNNNFYVRNFVHNQADEVQFDVQLPHSWLEGGNLFPHVHFSPWISSTGDKAAQFILEYFWTNVGDQFPASPSDYTMTKTWNGDQQWYHLIAGNATPLDATDKTLSSILKCRLYRDNTVANNLAGKVTFLYFDIHYEVDGFGSDEEYNKNTQSAILTEEEDYLLLETGDYLLVE